MRDRGDAIIATTCATDHRRWIGESILGPEYASAAPEPLVAVGKLDKSARLGSLPDTPWLYN